MKTIIVVTLWTALFGGGDDLSRDKWVAYMELLCRSDRQAAGYTLGRLRDKQNSLLFICKTKKEEKVKPDA